MSRFVRCDLLGDSKEGNKVIPIPDRVYYQQGDLILLKVDEIPPGAVTVESNEASGGGVDLGGGHVAVPVDKE